MDVSEEPTASVFSIKYSVVFMYFVCMCVLCWLFYWGTRWHSWLRYCATSQRSRVRFPMGSFWPPYGPGVDSASSRNEYQGNLLRGKCCRCVGLTTLPSSCADFVEIREASPSWSHTCMRYRLLYYSKGFNRLQHRSEHLNRWLSFSLPAVFLFLPFPVILWFIPCVILPSLFPANQTLLERGLGKWLMWWTEWNVNVLRLSKSVVKWSEGQCSEGG